MAFPGSGSREQGGCLFSRVDRTHEQGVLDAPARPSSTLALCSISFLRRLEQLGASSLALAPSTRRRTPGRTTAPPSPPPPYPISPCAPLPLLGAVPIDTRDVDFVARCSCNCSRLTLPWTWMSVSLAYRSLDAAVGQEEKEGEAVRLDSAPHTCCPRVVSSGLALAAFTLASFRDLPCQLTTCISREGGCLTWLSFSPIYQTVCLVSRCPLAGRLGIPSTSQTPMLCTAVAYYPVSSSQQQKQAWDRLATHTHHPRSCTPPCVVRLHHSPFHPSRRLLGPLRGGEELFLLHGLSVCMSMSRAPIRLKHQPAPAPAYAVSPWLPCLLLLHAVFTSLLR